MGRYFDALKAGVVGFKSGLAEAREPCEYSIAERPVRCPHCGHTKFASGRAMLNTARRTFFGFDWTDPSATILICGECGRIEWFAGEPDRAGQ